MDPGPDVKAESSRPEPLNPEETRGIADLLSFYSAETTSHAGLLVGFAVAFLAILQVRYSPQFSTSPSLFTLIQASLFFISVGGFYCTFRILLYGKLASVPMHAGVSAYRRALQARLATGEISEQEWTPLVKAASFSVYHLTYHTLKGKPLEQKLLMDMRVRLLGSGVLALLVTLSLALLGV